MKRLLRLGLGHGRLILALYALSLVVMGFGALHLRIDASIDSFYPSEHPVIKEGKAVQEAFGTGKTILAVLHAPDIFSAGALADLRAATKAAAAVEGVTKALSLASAPRLEEEDGFLMSQDLLPEGPLGPGEVADLKAYLAGTYGLRDSGLVGKDGRTATVVIRIETGRDEGRICAALSAALKKAWPGQVDLSGTPVLGSEILGIIKGIPLLAALALAVILLFLALNFRSALGVLLPLLTLMVGLLWGVGFLGWAGIRFLALMAIAPIAILAVGSSFSLHMLGRYHLELGRGRTKAEAIDAMVSETGLGVFVSGLAISASMLTFLFSELEMIRGMGILTAAGVLSCMAATLFLLPALLALLPAPKVRAAKAGTRDLEDRLRRLGRAVAARPRTWLALGLVLVGAAAIGVFRIVPDSSVVAYFSPGSAAIKGMKAVEAVFGGTIPVNVVVEGDLEDPAVLGAMLRFQEEARAIPGVGPAQSLATTVRSLHETLSGEAGLPASRDLVAQELLVYQSSGPAEDLSTVANLDFTKGLLTLIVRQLPSREGRAMLASLDALAARTIGTVATYRIMGDGMVLAILEAIILKDFILSLTLAILLVVAIDSLIRSLRAALVTITVLVFTIALQYGVLGYAGVTFTMATALMGALAIGVGDYAIHLTVRYMEDRRAGLSPEAAVESAVATSGRSILFTSLTLGGGFAALTLSPFVPVSSLGGLMVFTVIAVGGASLTLLPAACLVFLRNPPSRLEATHEPR